MLSIAWIFIVLFYCLFHSQIRFQCFCKTPDAFDSFFVVIVREIQPEIIPFAGGREETVSRHISYFSFDCLREEIPSIAAVR